MKDTMKNSDTWKTIIQFLIALLTALATALGVNACICHG